MAIIAEVLVMLMGWILYYSAADRLGVDSGSAFCLAMLAGLVFFAGRVTRAVAKADVSVSGGYRW